ncbi:MAG: ABC transporter substrate-binding protein [Anaerolineae bacterium]|nr:ABC transporter substrate-binding protein [Anaerolineae bacterium]
MGGTYGDLGEATRNGALLAAEEWNQRGGVLGRQISVVLQDDPCDPERAGEAIEILVELEDVAFIVGPVCGNVSEVVAQTAANLGVLVISPASVAPELTLDDSGNTRVLAFRIPVIDSVQGRAAARFALDTLEAETAAVIRMSGNDYANTAATAFAGVFSPLEDQVDNPDARPRVILEEVYTWDQDDFTSILENVLEAKVDVVYMPGYYDAVNRLALQARALGVNAVFLGSDGWHAPSLDLLTLTGSYFTTHFFTGDTRAEVQAWVSRYRNRYGVEPNALATLGYDAVNVLLAAIESANTLEPEAVASILQTETFPVHDGALHFDAGHNPIRPVPVIQVRSTRLQFETAIQP